MGLGKLPALLPLCMAVFMARDAMALGLGAANLDSKLGQPLFARIPIFGAEGIGSEQVRVSLHSVIDPDTGVEVGSVDTRSISAVGEMGNLGAGTIYLRSNEVVNEPYLHFLITVRWPGGQLSRAYTLLLDLPDGIASASNTQNLNNAALSLAEPLNDSRQSASILQAALSRGAAIENSPPQAINADTRVYTTVRGDSLWSIAQRAARAKGGGANEWMERLYLNNPRAFIRDNRNLLKERVTLDLFESVVDAQIVARSAAVEPPKLARKDELRGGSSRPPGPSPEAMKNAGLRREFDLGDSSASEALTEKQFLQESLKQVRTQVADVSANIALMTEKLAALEVQLASLNAQATSLNSEPSEKANSTPRPDAMLVESDGADSSSQFDDRALRDDILDDGVIVVDPVQSDEFSAEGYTEEANFVDDVMIDDGAAEQTVARVDSSPEMASHNTDSWSWLWWLLLPIIGVVVLLVRNRRESAAPYNTDDLSVTGELSDVSAAVIAKAQAERHLSKDHFNDIFSALDAKSVGRRFENSAPDGEFGEIDETEPKVGNPATLSAGAIGNTNMSDIDDDFFADLDEDALRQRGDLDDDKEFLALDINDLDQDWSASDASEEQIESFISRASACIELSDYAGAREILEEGVIIHRDNVALKMQLLDVYASSGERDEFENLASQIELSSSEASVKREIKVLREQLDKNTFFFGNGRAD
ncbi:type IV pilus assembly protein FimV [Zhongshania aquimaris]|uniref:FimV N-terminal domain-containing protein n=1 Tax=Zhongshania aquimaris TaxID=2857107 RepID=A0ABS6VNJ0_9GAMM|nr:hypothetical protein [Zhongshania aquimaris]MBW2939281.1 hypothetical protein [Zhongshania aquimaris]